MKDVGPIVGWYMYNLLIQHILTACRGGIENPVQR